MSYFLEVLKSSLSAFMLSPLVDMLRRFYIPRSLGSLFVLGVLISLIVFSINYLSQPAGVWLERFPSEIGEIQKKLSPFKESIETVQETTQSVQDITSIGPENKQATDVVMKGPNVLYTLLDGTQAFVISALSFIVLLYFMLAFGHSLAKQFGVLCRNLGYKTSIMRITQDVQQSISRYLFLITVINIILGIAVGIVMWLVGMPTPIVWGATAAFLNFIPYVGPAINIAIVATVSLLTFDGLTQILLPPALLLGLNVLEGQLIQPLFIGRMFTINPIVIFLFVLIWGWLWGMAGIFVAVPLLMIGRVILDQAMKTEPKTNT